MQGSIGPRKVDNGVTPGKEKQMKFFTKVSIALAAALVLIASMMDAAQAVELSQPVTLVANSGLAGSIYEETVLVAAPLPRGGHIGFILNRPTRVKLETVFPGHAPSRKVSGPLSLGGPVFATSVFAIARKAPTNTGANIALTSGLVAVFDANSVDRLIET